MGFLDKINPRATVSSVIHQALVGGISGAVVGAVVVAISYYFAMPERRSLTDYWPQLVGLTLVSMFVSAVYEWQVPEEAIGLLDLASRLERCFGVRISRDELSTMVTSNDPPDIRARRLIRFHSWRSSPIPSSRFRFGCRRSLANFPASDLVTPWESGQRKSRRKKGSMTSEQRGSCNA